MVRTRVARTIVRMAVWKSLAKVLAEGRGSAYISAALNCFGCGATVRGIDESIVFAGGTRGILTNDKPAYGGRALDSGVALGMSIETVPHRIVVLTGNSRETSAF